MASNIRIALIGDFNPSVVAHNAIPKALGLSGKHLGKSIEGTWCDTTGLATCDEKELAGFDGFWSVPATPYKSMDGALRAIRFARERTGRTRDDVGHRAARIDHSPGPACRNRRTDRDTVVRRRWGRRREFRSRAVTPTSCTSPEGTSVTHWPVPASTRAPTPMVTRG